MLLLNYCSVILSLFSFSNVIYSLQITRAKPTARPEICLSKNDFAEQLNCYLNMMKTTEHTSQNREFAILFVCSVTMALALILIFQLSAKN